MKHYINLKNYSSDNIEKILNTALLIKEQPETFSNHLCNKKIYLLFEKTSTRTSLSFEVGINELGGNYYSQKWQDSNFAIGEIKDEVRYIGRNVDLIMARLKQNQSINEMAEFSLVPVINGCCNKYHPCQAMADMLTIRELFGSYDIKLLYVGVRNNVFNSLLLSISKLGGEFYALTPIINEPSRDDEIIQLASATGRFHKINHANMDKNTFKDLVNEMDVIYTDTWIDMEFFNDKKYQKEKTHRLERMIPFQLNRELLKNSKAKILHDMPIHAGFEIDRETVEKNMKYILQQAENRRHAQKAIMLELLGK